MIPYGRQFIDDDDIKAVIDVLKSDYLTTGPKVPEFEEEFARRVGSKYAVAVSNGTAALHLACIAAGLHRGEMLLTTPMTFAASANCGIYCGSMPEFVDINDRGLIDPEKIEKVLRPYHKIIVPVHYAGFPCELDTIKELADKNGSLIVEDACHALGSVYKSSDIGNCKYSDMTVFSFHPVKHITTGEGGMITTNSAEKSEKLKMLRNHGMKKEPPYQNLPDGAWYHEMQVIGYNYRLNDIQAALGISQLKKLDKFIKRRKEIAAIYDDAFSKENDIETIKNDASSPSSYHLYPILVRKKRRQIFDLLRNKGIGVQVHYIPVYYHPYYERLGYRRGKCKVAENFYECEISIPIYPLLSDDEIQRTVIAVKTAVSETHF